MPGINDLTPEELSAVRVRTRQLAQDLASRGIPQEEIRTLHLPGLASLAVKEVTGRGLARPPSAADVLRQEAQDNPIKSSILSGMSRGIEGGSMGLIPMPELIGKMSGDPELTKTFMGEMDRVANENTTNRIVSGIAALPGLYPAARGAGAITKGIQGIPGVTDLTRRIAPVLGSALGFGAQEAAQPEITKLVAGREPQESFLSRTARGMAGGAALPIGSKVIESIAGRALPKAVSGVLGSSGGMAAYEAATGGDPVAGAAIGLVAHPLIHATGLMGDRLAPRGERAPTPQEIDRSPEAPEFNPDKPSFQFAKDLAKERAAKVDQATKEVISSPPVRTIINEAKGKGELKTAVEAAREIAEERATPSEEMPPNPRERAPSSEMSAQTRRQEIRQRGRDYAAKKAAETGNPYKPEPSPAEKAKINERRERLFQELRDLDAKGLIDDPIQVGSISSKWNLNPRLFEFALSEATGKPNRWQQPRGDTFTTTDETGKKPEAADFKDAPNSGALGIVANPEHLNTPERIASGARRLSRWLFDATVWDQKKAMKARMRLGEEVNQSVASELRKNPKLAAYLGFRDFDPWMQGVRQWAEDRAGRTKILLAEIEDRMKGMTPEQQRDLVMKTEMGRSVPGFEDLQRQIRAHTVVAARRQIRQREEVGDVLGEKRGIARETARQYQQPDSRYLKRIPSREFAKKKGGVSSILNLLSGGTAFKRGAGELPVMKLRGIAGMAKSAEPAIKSAQTKRRPLTTEEAASYRIYDPDGKPLAVGESVKENKHTITVTKDGKAREIPKSMIGRVEEPYVYDKRTLQRTVEESSAISISLKMTEMLKDERPDLWREPKDDGDPFWEKAEGAGFGVLEGKQVRADVMALLRFLKDPVENGLLHWLSTSSALVKMGMVVGRAPGGVVKQIPEMILTSMQLGVSPLRLASELPKKLQDLVKYQKTGEAAPWIRALQGGDLWQESTFQLSNTVGGRKSVSYRDLKGSGKEYLGQAFDTLTQDLVKRLNDVHMKQQKGRVTLGLFYTLGEIQHALSDFLYGLNPSQAMTGKSKVGGVRVSGEGLKDAFAMIDNVFRGVIYDDLRGGKLPMHQAALRKAMGKSATGTQFEPEEAIQLISSVLDPRTLSPALQPLRKYTFLSIPYMIAKHALTGGAITSPLGTAALFYTGKVMTLGVIAMLRALGHKVDEDEVRKQQLRLAFGDENRASQFALVPEPPDENGNYRFIDTRAISMEGGVGPASFNSFIPGANVQPAEDETGIGRVLRGAAAMSPIGSMVYEAATGESAVSGTKVKAASLPYKVARAATPFVPGAATIANWIADQERDAAAAERHGMQRSSLTNRIARALLGLPVQTSAATGTIGGFKQDQLIKYLQNKQKFIDQGGSFYSKEKKPTPPGAGATMDDWNEYRKAMSTYRATQR